MKIYPALLVITLTVISPCQFAGILQEAGIPFARQKDRLFLPKQWEPRNPIEPDLSHVGTGLQIQLAVEKLIKSGKLTADTLYQLLLVLLFKGSGSTDSPPAIAVNLPPGMMYQFGGGNSKPQKSETRTESDNKSEKARTKTKSGCKKKAATVLANSSSAITGMPFTLVSTKRDDVQAHHEAMVSVIDITLSSRNKPVGSGATSEVYKIEFNGRTYAVKKAKRKKYIQSLVQEAASLFEIDHPNIIQLEILAYSDSTAVLVFEYYATDLWGLLFEADSSHRSSSSKAINYLHQLASALAYLHARGHSHSDLKPENIFISKTGDLVLADLGNLGGTGQPHPTLNSGIYAAPEVQEGKRPDQHSDLWEFGIIIAFFLKPGEINEMLSANAGYMDALEFIRRFASQGGYDSEWESVLQISSKRISKDFIPDGSEPWNLLSDQAFLYALAVMCIRLNAEARLNIDLLKSLIADYQAYQQGH